MELDMQQLEIKNTTKCDCGHEFTLQDMTELNRIDKHGFYANVVKHFSNTKCPNCNKDTTLLLKQKGQTWEIVSLAFNKKAENTVEGATTKNEDISIQSQEFICPVCEKVCKSQIGLNSHMKTHQN